MNLPIREEGAVGNCDAVTIKRPVAKMPAVLLLMAAAAMLLLVRLPRQAEHLIDTFECREPKWAARG